jgi:hypothetical protein
MRSILSNIRFLGLIRRWQMLRSLLNRFINRLYTCCFNFERWLFLNFLFQLFNFEINIHWLFRFLYRLRNLSSWVNLYHAVIKFQLWCNDLESIYRFFILLLFAVRFSIFSLRCWRLCVVCDWRWYSRSLRRC